MKLVKTLPKYKCDFCKKRSVKHVMELHEKRCYRNPNRFCDACKNTGVLARNGYWNEDEEDYDNSCPYCKNFDKQMLKEIEEREEKAKTAEPLDVSDVPNINF